MKEKSHYTYSTISTVRMEVIAPSSFMRLDSICTDPWGNPPSLFGTNYLINRAIFLICFLWIGNTRVMCVCACECYTCVCFCMWKPEVDMRYFPWLLLTLFLRQVSDLTRLVNQQVPGILSLLLSAKITGMLCQFFCGCWKSKLRSSCLHRKLYWVSHLPSTNSEFLTV